MSTHTEISKAYGGWVSYNAPQGRCLVQHRSHGLGLAKLVWCVNYGCARCRIRCCGHAAGMAEVENLLDVP